jgi:four helix bundle protein
MEYQRRNLNRGYQQLRVWSDAISFYKLTWAEMADLPYALKRVVSQQVACVDSVHRNIAEGYCRRSINEYIHHLYIALGSLGESVSGLVAMTTAGQITASQHESMDALAFKLENGLIKLVASLEPKRNTKDWIDHMVVRESNEVYGSDLASPPRHDSITPPLQYSTTPTPHYSKDPLL